MRKRSIKEWMKKGIEWLKQHPSALIWIAIGGICFYIQSVLIGISFSSVELFSIDAIKDVLGTGAEVVAGMYGLTLTGYIFFLDRLQQKADDDEMLEDIITLLKKRYHNMVLVLSVTCFFMIVSAFTFIIYNADSALISDSIYRFWGCESVFMACSTLLFNIYFVIIIVDPDKIPRVSLQYKQKLSSSDRELGSLQAFLQDYEDIENLMIEKSAGLAVSQIGTNPWKAIKHLNGKERIEIRKLLDDPLLKDLTVIGQYYNYMVFSQELTVTKEICDKAKSVKEKLANLEM